MGIGSFPGVNRPGRVVDHPPPSITEVKDRVELYLYSPSGPSWPVLGRPLPLPLPFWTNLETNVLLFRTKLKQPRGGVAYTAGGQVYWLYCVWCVCVCVRDKGKDLWGKVMVHNRRYFVAIASAAGKIIKRLLLDAKLNSEPTLDYLTTGQ
jgi:hypothetical protein